MTNIVALIAATVLNLQTHLIPVKSNEALADLVIIEQIPMTQAQRVEKAKALYEKGFDYEYGITKTVDRTLADKFLKDAADLDDADALFFLGMNAIDNGDFSYLFIKKIMTI